MIARLTAVYTTIGKISGIEATTARRGAPNSRSATRCASQTDQNHREQHHRDEAARCPGDGEERPRTHDWSTRPLFL